MTEPTPSTSTPTPFMPEDDPAAPTTHLHLSHLPSQEASFEEDEEERASLSSISDGVPARPSMDQSLLEAQLAISGDVDDSIHGLADEMFVKTNEAFHDKIGKMEQHLGDDLQAQLAALKATQDERYKEAMEQVAGLETVNKHSRTLTETLATKDGAHRALEKEYAAALDDAEKTAKRQAAQKSKILKTVDARDAEIVELKNRLAALETRATMDQAAKEEQEAAVEKARRQAADQADRERTQLSRQVAAGERRAQEVELEMQDWKQLYESTLARYKRKMDEDLEARKKEIERAAQAKGVLAEKMQELEQTRGQLSEQQRAAGEERARLEQELGQLRERLRQQESESAARLGEVEAERENARKEAAKAQEALSARNEEIAQVQLRLEELEKDLEELREKLGAERQEKTALEAWKKEREEQEEAGKAAEKPEDGAEAGEVENTQKEAGQGEGAAEVDFGKLEARVAELSKALASSQKALGEEQRRREEREAELGKERERAARVGPLEEERNSAQKRQETAEIEIVDLNGKVAELLKKLAEKNQQLEVSGRYVFNLKQKLSVAAHKMRMSEQRQQEQRKGSSSPKKPVAKKYKATDPSDEVDRKFSEVLNLTDCPVPIERVGKGVYMFGNRRITATMQGGRLVIRVGGGFMVVTEFIRTYGQQELLKMEKKKEMSRQNSMVFDQAMSRQGSRDTLKSAKNVPKLNFDPSQRRQSAMAGSSGFMFKSPAKTDRPSLKGSALGAMKRIGSQSEIEGRHDAEEAKEKKTTGHGQPGASGDYSDMSYRSLRMQKNSLMDPEQMLASLMADESPPQKKNQTKVDVGLNGSMRVRDFNKTEKDMIHKWAGKASKKVKERAREKASKSMMLTETKFSTSKDVKETTTHYFES